MSIPNAGKQAESTKKTRRTTESEYKMRSALLGEKLVAEMEEMLPGRLDFAAKEGYDKVYLTGMFAKHLSPGALASGPWKNFVTDLKKKGYEVAHTQPEDFDPYDMGYTSNNNFFLMRWSVL